MQQHRIFLQTNDKDYTEAVRAYARLKGYGERGFLKKILNENKDLKNFIRTGKIKINAKKEALLKDVERAINKHI